MSNIFFVVENVQELLTYVVEFCSASIKKLSWSRLNDESKVGSKNVISSLMLIPSHIDEFNSDYRLTKTLIGRGLFIHPECKVLGIRDKHAAFQMDWLCLLT
jgi:hypothetical protein